MTVPPAPHTDACSLSGMHGLTPLAATTTTADPQAAYQSLRDQYGDVAPVELEPGVNAWLVMAYDGICHVVRHERLFARDPQHWRDLAEGRVPPDSGLGPMMFARENAYFKDGAHHQRLRRPLDHAVSGLPLPRVGRENREICQDLIAGFAAAGHADLVSDYAAVIPVLAVAKMFGLHTGLGHELRACLLALFGSGADSQAGNRRFEEILAGHLQARKNAPAADLTTRLLESPDLRNDFEIIQQMVLMISAGVETTTSWIAQAIRLMLTDPRFAGRLRGGRLGIDEALDEVLWRDPPMANMPARYALHDTAIGGRAIAKGDAIILGLAAANADPHVHSDDLWNEIGNRSHLAWSAGPHTCPAQVPARIIVKGAVETALHRLPGLRLATGTEDISLIPSPWTRCPQSLPVTFTPAPARRTAE